MGRTGLIPAAFADQSIKFRIPYEMPGELTVVENVAGNFFPEATFLHNVDKPFEIWGARIRVTGLDASLNPTEPQDATLDRLIRMRINDTSKNETFTKAPALISILRNSVAGAEGDWVWYVPYTLVRSEGFQVQVDALDFTNITAVNLRVELAFYGYLDIIQPASEQR